MKKDKTIKKITLFMILILVLFITGCENTENNEPVSINDIEPVEEIIDFSSSKKIEMVYVDYYVFEGIELETVQNYFNQLCEEGYQSYAGGVVDQSDVPQFNQTLNNPYSEAQIELVFYKDTLVVCTNAAYTKQGDAFLLAGVSEDAIYPENISQEKDLVLLDIAAGTDITIDQFTGKLIEDVGWDEVNNYGKWLRSRKGLAAEGDYHDNITSDNVLYIKEFYDESEVEGWNRPGIVLVWAKGKALYLEGNLDDGVNEYSFWEVLDKNATPGLEYLKSLIILIRPNYEGSGNGYETSGGVYSYATHATDEDYYYYKDLLINDGYVLEAYEYETEDYKEYYAAKQHLGSYGVWYQLIKDGDYIELEVGYEVYEGHHRDN